MTPYLLIVLINFKAIVFEFPSAGQCLQAQQEIQEQIKDYPNSVARCFEKLGGHGKEF